VVIQILLFGLIFLAPLLGPKLVEWSSPWDLIGMGLGVVLGLIGLVIALFGVLSLGQNLTAVPYPKEDAVLVVSGAFRIVRHPIYSGIILGSVGWGILTNSLLALLLSAVLFVFFDVKSRREELWLCEKYSIYPDYQARVRKLIPFIY
jgi:protein-S-isoprenylcysteine O-methyltransferase Ste14